MREHSKNFPKQHRTTKRNTDFCGGGGVGVGRLFNVKICLNVIDLAC